MEKALCPHCSQEIDLESIIKKPFAGKSKSKSLFNRMISGGMAIVSVAYICPHCNKIISIAQ